MKTAYNSFLVPTSFVSTAVLNTTTKKFNNSQQTRHFSTKWSYLLWANIIFGILCLPIVNSGYVKRSQYCPYSGNNVIYCKPQQDDFFRINDIAIIAWNTNNVLFANSDTLNISLFRRDPSNTARSFEVSAFAFQVNKAEGSTNVSVVSYWFPDYLTNKSQPTTTITQSQRFINYTFYLHIKPSVNIPNLPEIPDSDDFIAQYDRLFVNASDPSAVSTTTTSLLAATASVQTSSPLPVVATSTPSTISEDNTNNGNKVPLPVIVSVIVVALVAALLAFIALVVATRAKKRDIRPGKTKNLSSLSTSSNTPMVQADRSIVSDNADNANFIGNVHKDIDSPVEEESSINSTATLATNKLNPKISFNNDATNNNTNNSSHNNRSNNNPISLLDAALISDAFRKVMRKPDWKHDEEYTDEEDYDANLSEDELIRRREAKKLMEKELAEEGTGIHSVSRRHTKVEHSSSIHGENDDDDDDDIEKRNSSDVKDNDRSDVISGFDSSIINIEPENK